MNNDVACTLNLQQLQHLFVEPFCTCDLVPVHKLLIICMHALLLLVFTAQHWWHVAGVSQ